MRRCEVVYSGRWLFYNDSDIIRAYIRVSERKLRARSEKKRKGWKIYDILNTYACIFN